MNPKRLKPPSPNNSLSVLHSVLGFSLLEALVALALSALLVLAAVRGYSAMQNNQNAVEERVQVFAAASAAESALRRALQAAGHVDWFALDADGKSDWKRLLEHTQAPSVLRYGLAPLSVLSGSTVIRQGLQVVQQSAELDCLGLRPEREPLVQRFDIRKSAPGRQLYCKSFSKSSGPLSQPLVLGVEELTFRFLLDGAWTTILEGDVPTRVRAILVCLLVAGPKQILIKQYRATSQRPTCAAGPDGSFSAGVDRDRSDGRFWERFVFVVTLANARQVI